MNARPRIGLARGERSFSTKSRQASGVRRHKPDYWLLILSALLLTVGLVVVYSISPGLAASQHISQNYFITKQLIDVALGAAAFALAAYLPLSAWLKIAKPLAIAAAIGAIIVVVTPLDPVYHAHRWLRIGGLSFQVVELVKLSLIVWTASFLATKWQQGKLADNQATLKPLLIALAAVAIVVAKLQSDFGSAAVIVSVVGLMAFVAGVPLKKLAIIAGVVLIAVILVVAPVSYRRERLANFFHPQSKCQDSGYQACQALISVGSGGLVGLGLGYSVQAYGYLPEASNDSIFAIMAEKFGFVGSMIIILIYGLFITRLKQVIERTSDQFSRLIVAGVLAWFSTQLLINVGAMVGLLPLKGITLPLISQGGTSLVFLTAAIGLVFQISRYTNYNATEPAFAGVAGAENSFDRRRLGRPHNASLVSRPRA